MTKEDAGQMLNTFIDCLYTNLTEGRYRELKEAVEVLYEQKTGKWYEDEEVGLCRRDQCQAVNLIHTPFCPMCGAKMEVEE